MARSNGTRKDKEEGRARRSHSHSHSHHHHHQKEKAEGDVAPISEEDYFRRATEFRVWLRLKKHQYVDELSSDEAKRIFASKFVKRWNRGRLDRMYYDGIPERILERTKRTRHAWAFAGALDEQARLQVASIKDSVEVATRTTRLQAPDATIATREVSEIKNVEQERKRTRPDDTMEREDRDERRRHAMKRHRKEQAEVLEELVPRETGHEARLEKRRQAADRVHGAARAKEAQQDGLDISESFLMGSGSNELQDRLARRASARDRRLQDQLDRVAAAEAKENARMDQFLQDMGLASTNGSKPKLTIRPREDA